jgi:hypothetical protein
LRLSPDFRRRSPEAEPVGLGHCDVEMKKDERQEKKFDILRCGIFFFSCQMSKFPLNMKKNEN